MSAVSPIAPQRFAGHDAEQRENLLAVADFGRVVVLPRGDAQRVAIDFYPDLKGRKRRLWSFYGKGFGDEKEAEQVRTAINRKSENVGLERAVDEFRGRRSRKDDVWEICQAFLREAPTIGSLRTGEPYAPRTLAHYEAVLRRARPYFDGMSMERLFAPDELARFQGWFRAPKPEGRGLRTENERAHVMIALRAVVGHYRLTHPDFEVDWPSVPTKATIGKRALAVKRKQDRRGGLKLSLVEVVRGVLAIPEPKQPIFWILLLSQRRPTEARAVLGCDLDREEGRVWIERSASDKSPHAAVSDKSKNGKGASYPMPGFVLELFDRYCKHVRLNDQVPLCKNPDVRAEGWMWSEEALADTWRAALRRLDLPYVPLYQATKATSVSALLDMGFTVDDVVAQCQITREMVTDRYDKAPGERRDAIVLRLAAVAEEARR